MSRLDRIHRPAPLAATPVTAAVPPRAWRLVLLAALLAVGGAALPAVLAGASAAVEPDLAVLLRFMAAVKLGIALGAALLVDRRLRHPARPGVALPLIGAAALALLGPLLMLGLVWLRLGAALLYLGLGLLALLAWRDRGAIRALLAGAVAARRAG